MRIFENHMAEKLTFPWVQRNSPLRVSGWNGWPLKISFSVALPFRLPSGAHREGIKFPH